MAEAIGTIGGTGTTAPVEVVETLDPNGRRVLDVSGLGNSAMDWHAPVWWGNTLLIFIESTTIMLLLMSYFYLRRNEIDWPPVRANFETNPYDVRPYLAAGTTDFVLMLLSVPLMYWTDMRARRLENNRVVAGLWLMFAVTVACLVLRFFEFKALHFLWNENAYGSITWTILGTHATYLLATAAEFFIMAVYLMRHPVDPKHALDVTLAGGYWYWAVGTWVACYLVVFWGPRVL